MPEGLFSLKSDISVRFPLYVHFRMGWNSDTGRFDHFDLEAIVLKAYHSRKCFRSSDQKESDLVLASCDSLPCDDDEAGLKTKLNCYGGAISDIASYRIWQLPRRIGRVCCLLYRE